MKNRYLIELKQQQSVAITVEAESEQDARELALDGHGEHGQPFPPEVEVVTVRHLED